MAGRDIERMAGFRNFLAIGLIFGAAPLLAACSLMPTSGPSLEDLEDLSTDASFPYEVMEVDQSVIEALRTREVASLSSGISQQSTPAKRTLGVGDMVVVTIWESSAGGLFSQSASLTGENSWSVGGANSISLPVQQVNQEGMISVPYAGLIQASDMRPGDVAREIVAALKGRAIEPQALVTVSGTVTNQATVIGDAIQGGRIPLSGQNERILDVIATAGGITQPMYSVSVRLTRGGETVEAPLHRIISDPKENIIVQPGDVITLFKDPKTFTAFGATGRSTLASFDDEELMLDEALAKVGGIIDSRGEPSGVFVFRYETPGMMRKVGVPSAMEQVVVGAGPTVAPVEPVSVILDELVPPEVAIEPKVAAPAKPAPKAVEPASPPASADEETAASPEPQQAPRVFSAPEEQAPRVAVAYKIDLRKPSGLFFARNFPMENKDVLYVANAESSEFRKVLGLIGSVLSPASTSASIGTRVTP